MSDRLTKLAGILKINPLTIKATLIKWGIYLGFAAVILFSAYYAGRQDANASCDADKYKARAEVAEHRAKVAEEAAQRLAGFTYTEAQIEIAIANAKTEVHRYYAENPVQPRVVKVSELVQVPGEKEFVYVPEGVCPNDLFSPDELRLYNAGNAHDPKAVPSKM